MSVIFAHTTDKETAQQSQQMEGDPTLPDHRTPVVGSYECRSAHSMCMILILGTRTANHECIPNDYKYMIPKCLLSINRIYLLTIYTLVPCCDQSLLHHIAHMAQKEQKCWQ